MSSQHWQCQKHCKSITSKYWQKRINFHSWILFTNILKPRQEDSLKHSVCWSVCWYVFKCTDPGKITLKVLYFCPPTLLLKLCQNLWQLVMKCLGYSGVTKFVLGMLTYARLSQSTLNCINLCWSVSILATIYQLLSVHYFSAFLKQKEGEFYFARIPPPSLPQKFISFDNLTQTYDTTNTIISFSSLIHSYLYSMASDLQKDSNFPERLFSVMKFPPKNA